MPTKKTHHSPHSLRSRLHFLSRFILKPHSVGSVWPSSRHLGKAMIEDIDFQPGDVVVEYGPGTGPFTSLLRQYLPQGIEYLGIEYDRKLCESLQHRFPEMRFHHGSAEETLHLLKHYQLGPARLVVSGLPFANMPPPLQERILTATQQALRPDGIFRTFTYLLSSMSPHSRHFRKKIADHFHHDHGSKTVMLNFPPARVLSYAHPIRGNASN